MTYDRIPFNDTHDPTHHSWAFFPAQTIGSTVFERSPGSAATIGPSTYGGGVQLLSRSLHPDRPLHRPPAYRPVQPPPFPPGSHHGRQRHPRQARPVVVP